MKPSIAIDMDETIADTLTRHIDWYEESFAVTLNRNRLNGYKIYDVAPAEHLETVRGFPRHPDFFKGLDVKQDAVDAIRKLSESYDIYFASAAMEYPTSFTAKYEWLREHFPFISDMNYIFCGFKGMLNCDYLIDDSPRHIDAFNGKGLLYSAPHNIYEEGYERVASWREIVEKLT